MTGGAYVLRRALRAAVAAGDVDGARELCKKLGYTRRPMIDVLIGEVWKSVSKERRS